VTTARSTAPACPSTGSPAASATSTVRHNPSCLSPFLNRH
jgi:hypothetical protein